MGWLSYYAFWFVAPMILAVVSHHPAVLVVVVVGLLGRRWLPDPYVLLKNFSRASSLSRQVSVNPGNVTARRDLAKVYLEQRRPKKAIPLLMQAMERDPRAAELHYLLGLAHLRAGNVEESLGYFVESVSLDARTGFGDPFLKAGDALRALGRLDEAEDAYDRFVSVNSSSLEGWCKLAAVRGQLHDGDGANTAVKEAVSTFNQLPWYHRRRQWFWYLRARIGWLPN